MKDKVIILPDVASLTRKLTSKSQIMLVVDGFFKLPIKSKIGFVVACLPMAGLVLKKDYSAGVMLLVLLDYFSLKRTPKTVYLHNQMFDMAVVFNKKELVPIFVNFFNKKNISVGFLTANHGLAIKYLSFCNLSSNNVKVIDYNGKTSLIYFE